MDSSYGQKLRDAIDTRPLTCFIGVFDCFSARVAADHFDALFLSGFGFAASHYGLPDTGFVAWPDMLAYAQRVRAILPDHHLLVDVDDGYGDADQAVYVVRELERAGASGVILEDQKRPRRCGHLSGKQVADLGEYLLKLRAVLKARCGLYVVARTDSAESDDRLRRILAFQEAGADAVLVDGLEDLGFLKRVAQHVTVPVMFNQIAGGRSPSCTISELIEAGARLVNYSAPCLFPAQAAMRRALIDLKRRDGRLPRGGDEGFVGLQDCDRLLRQGPAAPDASPAPRPQADTSQTRSVKSMG